METGDGKRGRGRGGGGGTGRALTLRHVEGLLRRRELRLLGDSVGMFLRTSERQRQRQQ